jgi:endonuclease/exonuclease/phosphatase family metal-dependent hydrolase
MRLATFNLENLDYARQAPHLLEQRIDILRPQLERLSADILCLQEVNAQHVKDKKERSFVALDQLLTGTRYAQYERVTSHLAGTRSAADVHNIAILSRFPIVAQRELWHQFVPPMTYRCLTARLSPSDDDKITFDRPALAADIAVGQDAVLTIMNVHLRAPLAAIVPGQKRSAASWATTSGWAEGFFIASMKRNAQALDVRLAVDEILQIDPNRCIAIAGDFNAGIEEVPLKILQARKEDTGNSDLARLSLIPVDSNIARGRRYSVLHDGQHWMPDHILASYPLQARLASVEIHNEALIDKCIGRAGSTPVAGSTHAPLVAEFAL